MTENFRIEQIDGEDHLVSECPYCNGKGERNFGRMLRLPATEIQTWIGFNEEADKIEDRRRSRSGWRYQLFSWSKAVPWGALPLLAYAAETSNAWGIMGAVVYFLITGAAIFKFQDVHLNYVERRYKDERVVLERDREAFLSRFGVVSFDGAYVRRDPVTNEQVLVLPN